MLGTDKKFIIISGLNLNDNNRGTAALGYGAIQFLIDKGYLQDNQILLNIKVFRNPFKRVNRICKTDIIEINGVKWKFLSINVFFIELLLYRKIGLSLPFTLFGKTIKQISMVAAINGGDGFSDIYNTKTFLSRLFETKIAMAGHIPLILLPQTLGPFKSDYNRSIANKILRYSYKIYIRDFQFARELDSMGLHYEFTKDLSFYMRPCPFTIDICDNSIGLNVSGLAYFNNFRDLSGQFCLYPKLIEQIIIHFKNKGRTIYLIPHSYNYKTPEINNDDLAACRLVYSNLIDKSNVVLVDNDLISPQVKYIISRMGFFIGTRMHANFAAIYTNVPVFGLAYSYKFKGAFNANGLDGNNQTVMINNINEGDIPKIIDKIELFYRRTNKES